MRKRDEVDSTDSVVSENTKQEKKSKKTHEAFLVEKMQKKYISRYESGNEQSLTPEQIEKEKISKQQTDKWLDSVAEAVTKFEREISSGTKVEASRAISEINRQLEFASNMKFSIEQARKLRELAYSDFFTNQDELIGGFTKTVLKMQRFASNQLKRAIEREVHETKDLDRLKELQALVPEKIVKRKSEIGDINTIIKRKISTIERELNLQRLQQEVLPEIHEIAAGISSGKLDIEQAKLVIEDMVAKRMESTPKTRFGLTEDQQRNQVYIKIRTALREHPEKYPIINPEKAMTQLDTLTGGETGINLNAVVENLTDRRQFTRAKEISSAYRKKAGDSELGTYIGGLQKKITATEIGNLVSMALSKPMTDEEKENFWNTLKNGINRNRLSLSSIVVGKNQDKTRTITLQDIWPEQERNK